MVTGARELLGAGHARGSRAHHRHPLPGARPWRLRHHPALFPAAVDDEVLDRLDAHRVGIDIERAGRFARRRAYPAGEFGEVVRRVQHVERLTPLVPVDQVIPVRNDVVDGAARLAEGYAAIHAACTLTSRLLILEPEDELAVVAHPLPDRLRNLLDALKLHETGDLAHHAVSLCLLSTALSALTCARYCSPNARRYSCGNTLTNLPRAASQWSSSESARVLPVKRRCRSIKPRSSSSSHCPAWSRRPLPAAASSSSTWACTASVTTRSSVTIALLQRWAKVPSGS